MTKLDKDLLDVIEMNIKPDGTFSMSGIRDVKEALYRDLKKYEKHSIGHIDVDLDYWAKEQGLETNG